MGNSHLRGYSSVSSPSDPGIISYKRAELIYSSFGVHSGTAGGSDRGGHGRLPDGSRQDQIASAAPFAGRSGGYTQVPVGTVSSPKFPVHQARHETSAE
jgi:hypothetical protein